MAQRSALGTPDGFERIGGQGWDDSTLLDLGFDAAFVELAHSFTPASVPVEAVPILHAVAPTATDPRPDVRLRDDEGRVEGRLFLGSGPRALDLNVVCTANWRQAPCAQGTPGWRIELGENEFVAPTFDITAAAGDELGFIWIVDDGVSRPFPATGYVALAADREPDLTPPAPGDSLRTGPVFSGCDLAALLPSLEPRESPNLGSPVRLGDSLYLIVQLCEPPPDAIAVMLVSDRADIRDLGPPWGAAVAAPEDGVLAIEVPRRAVQNSAVLQVVVRALQDGPRSRDLVTFEVSVEPA